MTSGPSKDGLIINLHATTVMPWFQKFLNTPLPDRVRIGIVHLGVLPLLAVLFISDKPWQVIPADRALKIGDYLRKWFWVLVSGNVIRYVPGSE